MNHFKDNGFSIKLFTFLLPIILFSCKKPLPTAMPQRKEIVDAVFASGSIISKSEYFVAANADGFLVSSGISEGDTVKTGQTLFRIDNGLQTPQVENAAINLQYANIKANNNAPQITQLQYQIAQAKQQASLDSINNQRYQRLLPTQAVSKIDAEKAALQFSTSANNVKVLEQSLADLQLSLQQNRANSQKQLEIQQQSIRYYNLSSTINGVVLTVNKKNGDYVKKGEIIAHIGAGKTVIKLFIAEEDIQRVHLGQKAIISLNTDKNRVYSSFISKIYPSFDTDNQSFVAEATFDTLPPRLTFGTQLQANIVVETKNNALVIPAMFLLPGDSVVLKETKAKVAVKVGIRNLDWCEILGGISDNQAITTIK